MAKIYGYFAAIFVYLYFFLKTDWSFVMQGRTKRGRGAKATPPPSEGGTPGGGEDVHLIFLHFPSSGNLHSSLPCIALTQTKRLRKEINYILIHNNTLQSFVWSSIALNIHVSHFENWLFIFLFVVSLQKWLKHFLLQKRWRYEGFKGTSDMPL